MSTQTTITNNITEAEWEELADAWPPVIQRESGELIVLAGIWSTGHRSYRYANVEVAGTAAYQSPRAAKVATAWGKDVEEFLNDCDSEFDGYKYRSSGYISRCEVFIIPAEIPVRVKIGDTSMSSSGRHYGASHVYFYGGPKSGPGYRAACNRL